MSKFENVICPDSVEGRQLQMQAEFVSGLIRERRACCNGPISEVTNREFNRIMEIDQIIVDTGNQYNLRWQQSILNDLHIESVYTNEFVVDEEVFNRYIDHIYCMVKRILYIKIN
jgi:hypothetical protein